MQKPRVFSQTMLAPTMYLEKFGCTPLEMGSYLAVGSAVHIPAGAWGKSSLRHFTFKNRTFAKTGSGQTQGTPPPLEQLFYSQGLCGPPSSQS